MGWASYQPAAYLQDLDFHRICATKSEFATHTWAGHGVILQTPLGGERILEELEDDPLPRIC